MDQELTQLLQTLFNARYEEGRRDGYEAAMAELKDALGAAEQVTLPNDDDKVGLAMRRALEFLGGHPGARYSEVKRAIGNGTVLYRLVKRGYAENRSGEFYLK